MSQTITSALSFTDTSASALTPESQQSGGLKQLSDVRTERRGAAFVEDGLPSFEDDTSNGSDADEKDATEELRYSSPKPRGVHEGRADLWDDPVEDLSVLASLLMKELTPLTDSAADKVKTEASDAAGTQDRHSQRSLSFDQHVVSIIESKSGIVEMCGTASRDGHDLETEGEHPSDCDNVVTQDDTTSYFPRIIVITPSQPQEFVSSASTSHPSVDHHSTENKSRPPRTFSISPPRTPTADSKSSVCVGAPDVVCNQSELKGDWTHFNPGHEARRGSFTVLGIVAHDQSNDHASASAGTRSAGQTPVQRTRRTSVDPRAVLSLHPIQ